MAKLEPPRVDLSLFGAPGRRPLVGHRGVPARHPENGASSLAAARDAGAAGVELDVQLLGDGTPVLLHDRDFARVAGVAREAHTMSLADFGALRFVDRPGEALITLDEALALLVGRVVIDVEIKPQPSVAPETAAAAVIEALVRAGSPAEALVSSSDLAILAACAERAPGLARGLVVHGDDERDPLSSASGVLAGLLVVSARRLDAALADAAESAGLGVWSYTAHTREDEERLFALGCEAVLVDDLPAFVAAGEGSEGGEAAEVAASNAAESTGAEGAPQRAPGAPAPRVLVIDLGSSWTKAALVDVERGLVARASRPTPLARAEGRVEHDPEEVARAARALVEELADRHPERPIGVAIASQRSTGLIARKGSLAPLTPAISWRDPRADVLEPEAAIGRLGEPERAGLEAEAGLVIAPAWTALRLRSVLGASPFPEDSWLLPLGSFVAARLSGADLPPVDPTLANRTFLLHRSGARWSPLLAAALGIPEAALPPLAPSVGELGAIAWPAGGGVPLLVLAGDQQCAYVGAAGPLGERLVANVGSAGFVMRRASAGEPLPPGVRRAPLWSSPRSPEPPAFLAERVVRWPEPSASNPAPGLAESASDAWARGLARRIAAGGDEASRTFASELAAALREMAAPTQRSGLLAGGALACPQLVRRLLEAAPLPLAVAGEPEITILGAARLAAAAARLPFAIEPGGGSARLRVRLL